ALRDLLHRPRPRLPGRHGAGGGTSRRSVTRRDLYGSAMAKNQRSVIRMSDAEIGDYLQRSRTMNLATLGEDGHPHLVAMWYAWIDGEIWFETKAKSQKAVNLRRDPRVTCLVEDGLTYDRLRGVSVEGRAEIVDDADA